MAHLFHVHGAAAVLVEKIEQHFDHPVAFVAEVAPTLRAHCFEFIEVQLAVAVGIERVVRLLEGLHRLAARVLRRPPPGLVARALALGGPGSGSGVGAGAGAVVRLRVGRRGVRVVRGRVPSAGCGAAGRGHARRAPPHFALRAAAAFGALAGHRLHHLCFPLRAHELGPRAERLPFHRFGQLDELLQVRKVHGERLRLFVLAQRVAHLFHVHGTAAVLVEEHEQHFDHPLALVAEVATTLRAHCFELLQVQLAVAIGIERVVRVLEGLHRLRARGLRHPPPGLVALALALVAAASVAVAVARLRAGRVVQVVRRLLPEAPERVEHGRVAAGVRRRGAERRDRAAPREPLLAPRLVRALELRRLLRGLGHLRALFLLRLPLEERPLAQPRPRFLALGGPPLGRRAVAAVAVAVAVAAAAPPAAPPAVAAPSGRLRHDFVQRVEREVGHGPRALPRPPPVHQLHRPFALQLGRFPALTAAACFPEPDAVFLAAALPVVEHALRALALRLGGVRHGLRERPARAAARAAARRAEGLGRDAARGGLQVLEAAQRGRRLVRARAAHQLVAVAVRARERAGRLRGGPRDERQLALAHGVRELVVGHRVQHVVEVRGALVLVQLVARALALLELAAAEQRRARQRGELELERHAAAAAPGERLQRLLVVPALGEALGALLGRARAVPEDHDVRADRDDDAQRHDHRDQDDVHRLVQRAAFVGRDHVQHAGAHEDQHLAREQHDLEPVDPRAVRAHVLQVRVREQQLEEVRPDHGLGDFLAAVHGRAPRDQRRRGAHLGHVVGRDARLLLPDVAQALVVFLVLLVVAYLVQRLVQPVLAFPTSVRGAVERVHHGHEHDCRAPDDAHGGVLRGHEEHHADGHLPQGHDELPVVAVPGVLSQHPTEHALEHRIFVQGRAGPLRVFEHLVELVRGHDAVRHEHEEPHRGHERPYGIRHRALDAFVAVEDGHIAAFREGAVAGRRRFLNYKNIAER